MEFADFVVYKQQKETIMNQVQFLLEALLEVRNNEWKVNHLESGSDNPYFSKAFITQGRKYFKVMTCDVKSSSDEYNSRSHGSVFMFVDKVTGDVLKPASLKAPAKGVRFNLLNEEHHNWLCDNADQYGSFSTKR